MALQQIGEKWYLYCAHFSAKGWSVLEVTNPAQPKLKYFVLFIKKGNRQSINLQIVLKHR